MRHPPALPGTALHVCASLDFSPSLPWERCYSSHLTDEEIAQLTYLPDETISAAPEISPKSMPLSTMFLPKWEGRSSELSHSDACKDKGTGCQGHGPFPSLPGTHGPALPRGSEPRDQGEPTAVSRTHFTCPDRKTMATRTQLNCLLPSGQLRSKVCLDTPIPASGQTETRVRSPLSMSGRAPRSTGTCLLQDACTNSGSHTAAPCNRAAPHIPQCFRSHG